MPGPVLQVIGAKELRRDLRRAGDDLADLKAAHAAVGQVVATRGRAIAPHLTGRTAQTIRASAAKTQAIVRAGTAAVPYVPVIHWGWPRRHISANPWLSKAAQDTETTWLTVYETALRAIINKVGGRTP